MKNLLLGLSLLSIVGCVGEADIETTRTQSSEIIGGQSFSGLPAVGAMVVNGSPSCTGTLIEKRKVLTAAHCLEGLRGNVQFTFGRSAFNPTESIPVEAFAIHPGYDSRNISNDIGYLVLSRDATVQPMEVLTESMDQSWVGRTLLFVGYGATNGNTGSGGGFKRSVSMQIDQVGGTQFAYIDSNRNTCFGDSGGPAFWRDPVSQELKVAGVTSYGDQTCAQFGVDTRVDTYIPFLDLAPIAAPIDPCQGETFEGRCDGDSVIWCEDEEVKSIDCQGQCGFQASRGISNCL